MYYMLYLLFGGLLHCLGLSEISIIIGLVLEEGKTWCQFLLCGLIIFAERDLFILIYVAFAFVKLFHFQHQVVDLVRKAVPLALTSDDDPRREELKSLLEKKQQLDILAHKEVRCILWTGLGGAVLQVGLFFRLIFWEFSWDVMEPIGFFTTATGIVVGYAYFLFTSRDPTYQDFMQRLFLSRQRKLIKKHNFDFDRFVELQKECNCPFDGHSFSRQTFGTHIGHEDSSINL